MNAPKYPASRSVDQEVVERLAVGHPQPVPELALLPEALEELAEVEEHVTFLQGQERDLLEASAGAHRLVIALERLTGERVVKQ